MKSAVVLAAGQTPVYTDFQEPVAAEGESLVTVRAAALSHVTRSRASGTHYSSAGIFPFVAGIDGVGRLEDGRRVYFLMPEAPFGAMAERVAVSRRQVIALPEDLDDVTAAAIANPGMSAWAAYTERARLKAGETVLVNGATSTAGRLAVQIAKYMGAKKVIATGRNLETLKTLEKLGVDVIIPLGEDADVFEDAVKAQFENGGIDVVLDYLWGESARRILIAAAKGGQEAVPVRFVHIGSVAGPEIALPSAVFRASAVELMGSGIGSIPAERLKNAIAELFQATGPGGFQIATKEVPLSEVAEGWAQDSANPRTVFVIGKDKS